MPDTIPVGFQWQSRMTPDGQWVRRLVGPWIVDEDATEGRSIVENDAIQADQRDA